jgi:hypothetical protein
MENVKVEYQAPQLIQHKDFRLITGATAEIVTLLLEPETKENA